MKALVTGCAGFIGSQLCEKLLSEKFEVIGVDVLTDYYDPEIKKSNLRNLINSSGFTFIQSDLMAADFTELAKEIDFVFHLAAQPGVRGSWGDKFSTYVTNNILTTQRLLEATKNSHKLKKVVYASSSSVYGQIKEENVNEDHKTAPHSPYGATKLAGENLCFLYDANYGMPVVSLRLFTVYGPRQRPDMAFAKLIHAGMSGKKFPLYGDGKQERDFTFVLDVVEGMRLAALSADARGIFNIGGGHVVSMQTVIGLIEEILGSKINIEYKNLERGDVRRTSADISKSREVLGFAPKHDIKTGLQRQVEFMQKHFDLYANSIGF
ncbi:MAG: GDP-mannose 4,6-dehydratase [Bacteroidetes bacterium]|nr:GDP-mannose 4,6-dehydratase [Bacteroidota bacterium]MCL5737068.1 GDP-mannose 4,6-dehydratase [Bacteroidota bacterium]